MPQSVALPHLRTRRGNNEIRNSNLGNPYSPHTIVPLQGVSISRYATLDVFSYKCEKILSPAAKLGQSGCKAAFINAPSLPSVTHGKSREISSILSTMTTDQYSSSG